MMATIQRTILALGIALGTFIVGITAIVFVREGFSILSSGTPLFVAVLVAEEAVPEVSIFEVYGSLMLIAALVGVTYPMRIVRERPLIRILAGMGMGLAAGLLCVIFLRLLDWSHPGWYPKYSKPLDQTLWLTALLLPYNVIWVSLFSLMQRETGGGRPIEIEETGGGPPGVN